MHILKVSDTLPVMLKEMGNWKQVRGEEKKPKANNQLVYEEDPSSWMSSRNGMGRDGLAQSHTPHRHSLLTGVTASPASALRQKYNFTPPRGWGAMLSTGLGSSWG